MKYCISLFSVLLLACGCAGRRPPTAVQEYRISDYKRYNKQLSQFEKIAGYYGKTFPLSGTHGQVIWEVEIPDEPFSHVAINALPTGTSSGYLIFDVLRDKAGEPSNDALFSQVIRLVADQHGGVQAPLVIPVPHIGAGKAWFRITATQSAKYEQIINFSLATDYVGKCINTSSYTDTSQCPGFAFLKRKK